MDRAQIYNGWGIPFITSGAGKLVAREHAIQLIEHVYRDDYYFLGYEAFTVFPNGSRQPHLEFSASFSKERQRTLAEAVESLKDDPAEVTHYEFVFVPRVLQLVQGRRATAARCLATLAPR